MGSWINKATGIRQVSQDPPLAEQGDYVHADTLPEGCESWDEVVVDGDTIRAPNESELAARAVEALAAAKSAKMSAIDARTAAIIESGSVTVNGVAIFAGLTNQVSLQALQQLVTRGVATWPQPISAVGGGAYTITSQADMDRVSGLVATFVMTTKAAGRTLRAAVLAATTLAEVAAVEDSR